MASQRRRRAWADQRFASQVIASGSQVVFDLLANAPTIDTMTVARIIGYLQVEQDPSGDNEGSQSIDVGIGVSSVEAFTIGPTALPDPFSETEYPPRGWLYVASKQASLRLVSGGGTPTPAIFEFDLGAMRKIDKGVLFLYVRNTASLGTAFTVHLSGRVRSMCLT